MSFVNLVEAFLEPLQSALGMAFGLLRLDKLLFSGQLPEFLEQGLQKALGPRGILPLERDQEHVRLENLRTCRPLRMSSCAGSSKAATSDAKAGLALNTCSARLLLWSRTIRLGMYRSWVMGSWRPISCDTRVERTGLNSGGSIVISARA